MSSGLYNRCIFLLADGARADRMRELVAAGELPNIKKFITDPGAAAQATTVFPSTTGPAYLPFSTGRFPGPCNVPGIRWFDRQAYAEKSPFSISRTRSYCGIGGWRFNSDLSPEVPTIFELRPASFNMHNPIARGLPRSRRRFKLGLNHILAHYTADHRFIHRAITESLRRAVCEEFDFIFCSLPGPDHTGHYKHLKSEECTESYREIDETVGEICEVLSRIGCLEDTLFFISADHGMTETHTHFDLEAHLMEQKFKLYSHPNVFRHWTDADSALMVSGNSMANLYFRGKSGWTQRTVFEELDGGRLGDVIDRMLEFESVEMLAGPGEDGAVRVKTREGMARIERRAAGKIAYEVLSGTDPFGYGGLPKVMDDRQALDLTFDSEYPDALVQLTQVFESARAGDLVACASDGHDLRLRFEHPEHMGSHGALTRHQMLVPFLTNHPIEEDQPYRTVDFFPTVFNLLGWQAPEVLDGMDVSGRKSRVEAA